MERGKYISDEAVVKRANAAVCIEIEKNKAMDVPVVIYDRELGQTARGKVHFYAKNSGLVKRRDV